jgi:hypothetical protein
MCRNIKTLFNFEPPATEDEIHASALQFVRKLSGFNKPSQANEAAFDRAVAEVSDVARRLLTSLHTQAPARDRAVEADASRKRGRSVIRLTVSCDACVHHRRMIGDAS